MVNEDCYPSARAIDAVLMRTFFLSADRQLPFFQRLYLWLLLLLYYVDLVYLILLAGQMSKKAIFTSLYMRKFNCVKIVGHTRSTRPQRESHVTTLVRFLFYFPPLHCRSKK